MLIWEFFQIMGECREDKNKQSGAKCNLRHCKPHQYLSSSDLDQPRDQKLPVPRLLEANDEAKKLKERMHKCWRYESQKKIRQET